MATVVDFCNAAISHCGTRSKITSIDEGTPEATACLNHYDFVRDATLRAYDWNCARMTTQLAQLTCKVSRWMYEFALPVDCLRLRRLNDIPVPAPQQWYELAADKDSMGNYIGVLFCNVPSVAAIYTAQVTDTERWDAGLADAVTYGLAARICYELNGKVDRAKELTQMWQAMLHQAAADMMNESPNPSPAYVPEMLQVRGYDDGQDQLGQAWPETAG